jgi:hypothetical protein
MHVHVQVVANPFVRVFLVYSVIVPYVVGDITAPVSCEIIEPNNVALHCFGYNLFFCELRCFLLHHGIVDDIVLSDKV